MTPDDAEEFTQTIEQIGAGWWRQIAWADRQGIPAALGLSTREWVEQRIGGYVRLSIPERREAVVELTEQGLTQREVADVLGVAQKTVDRDLESFDSPDNDDRPERESDDSTPPAGPERVREEELGRRARRLEMVCSGWPEFRDLRMNNDRDDVLSRLADSDRQQIATIEGEIEWKI